MQFSLTYLSVMLFLGENGNTNTLSFFKEFHNFCRKIAMPLVATYWIEITHVRYPLVPERCYFQRHQDSLNPINQFDLFSYLFIHKNILHFIFRYREQKLEFVTALKSIVCWYVYKTKFREIQFYQNIDSGYVFCRLFQKPENNFQNFPLYNLVIFFCNSPL